VLLILSFRCGKDFPLLAFHLDEAHWIGTSSALEALINAPLSSPEWEKSYTTLTQPPVPRYLIGIGRRLGGYTPADLAKVDWQQEIKLAEIQRREQKPSSRLVIWSRAPMVLLTIGCALGVFVLACSLAGLVAGYSWVVLFYASDFLRYHLRLAMAEAALLSAILAALAIAIWITRREDRSSRPAASFWRFFLFGALAGCAGAIKLNGLATAGAGLVVALGLSVKDRAPIRRTLALLALRASAIGAGTVLFFVGLNPFLWPAPVARTTLMLEQRLTEMKDQAYEQPDKVLDRWDKRAERVPRQIFLEGASLRMRGMYLVNVGLSLLALALLLHRAYGWIRDRSPDGVAFCTLAVAGMVSTPTLFSPLDWGRYFLLPTLFSTIFIAIAIGWLSLPAIRLIKSRVRS
jgi:hypothetical protein